MSFSSEQKTIIIGSNIKSPCCRRSLLQGALFGRARAESGVVTMSVEQRTYAEGIAQLVREFYGKVPEILPPPRGGRCVILSFSSNSASNYLSKTVSVGEPYTRKCPSCVSYFLRGVFLTSGKISDPQKQYSLEFTLEQRSDIFRDYLFGLGLSFGVADKRNGRTVYSRNSTQIEDFLGHANMNQAMFSLIEARFSAEARKNIMRALNCETKNMQKTVDAAVEQSKIIARLAEGNLLSSLPDELLTVAKLRLEYPDYSLARLAAEASMSKSGLTHRMNKLIEYGKRLLDKK